MKKIVKLHFNGPLLITDYYDINYDNKKVSIKESADQNDIKRKTIGFYIWGHLHGNKFIPYYVGEIHSTGILERIREHIKSIIKEDSTLTRLSKNYLYGANDHVPFYIDEFFQKGTPYSGRTRLPDWVAANEEYFKKRIDYLNNLEFLEKIKGVKNPKFIKSVGYPISNLNMNRETDDQLLVGIRNMYFMWAEHMEDKALFEKIEGYIKYSLKGKTFGFSDTLSTIIAGINHANTQVEISCVEKLSYIFKDKPSDNEFPGY
jgi:hypothetical protein